MSAPRPLATKIVVITRSADDSLALRQMLEALGAEVFEVPCIEIVPQWPSPGAAQARALQALGRARWIAFASRHGVQQFAAWSQAVGATLPLAARLAAVGPATADQVRRTLAPAAAVAVAEPHSGEGLAALLLQQGLGPGEVVLLPAARDGRRVVEQALRERGIEAVRLTMYATVPRRAAAPGADPVRMPPIVDSLAFSSPSCVQGFLALTPRVPAGAKLCSIGPATSAALHAAGLKVAAQARPHSLRGLVEAVVQALSSPGHACQRPSPPNT